MKHRLQWWCAGLLGTRITQLWSSGLWSCFSLQVAGDAQYRKFFNELIYRFGHFGV